MARDKAMNRNEPSDSVRAVNALLTQIDRIRRYLAITPRCMYCHLSRGRYGNGLVLTTSNLSDCLDTAFLDRADIKRRIPSPSASAIYSIYISCIRELGRVSITLVYSQCLSVDRFNRFRRIDTSV